MIPAISEVLIISDDGEACEAIGQMLGREDSWAANRDVTTSERLSSDLSTSGAARLGANAAIRMLPRGPDDDRRDAPRQETSSDRRGYR